MNFQTGRGRAGGFWLPKLGSGFVQPPKNTGKFRDLVCFHNTTNRERFEANKHQCLWTPELFWLTMSEDFCRQKTNTQLRTWPMPERSLLNFHADSDYFHLATQMCNQDEEIWCPRVLRNGWQYEQHLETSHSEQMLLTCALISSYQWLDFTIKKPWKHFNVLGFIILIIPFCFKEVTL